MSQEFDAIYENGVFRPLKPVGYREHEVVTISVTTSDDAESLAVAIEQRQALLAFAAKMQAIKQDLPSDRITGRDHDRILYGEPS